MNQSKRVTVVMGVSRLTRVTEAPSESVVVGNSIDVNRRDESG